MFNKLNRIFISLLIFCAAGAVSALGASIFEDNFDARALGNLCATALWTCSAPTTNVTVSNAFANTGATAFI